MGYCRCGLAGRQDTLLCDGGWVHIDDGGETLRRGVLSSLWIGDVVMEAWDAKLNEGLKRLFSMIRWWVHKEKTFETWASGRVESILLCNEGNEYLKSRLRAIALWTTAKIDSFRWGNEFTNIVCGSYSLGNGTSKLFISMGDEFRECLRRYNTAMDQRDLFMWWSGTITVKVFEGHSVWENYSEIER